MYAAAGQGHFVLVKGDGTAAAYAGNVGGECDVPALDADLFYGPAAVVVQLIICARTHAGDWVFSCRDVTGNDLCSLEISPQEGLPVLQQRLAEALAKYCTSPHIVTASGRVPSEMVPTGPLDTLTF
eukprot:TRINITY_DN25284_c0_g1_i3.p3 TRINITY_DN25284_c0_g1~~TRINITY_DN25284_c0_g1_i3.p3  ORF type:complete len:127 (+),score=15.58 TRINITY_DN25284_c0_g1_i3:812-1192(+)